MSNYDNEFNRGYNDPTYKGTYDARAASEGRAAYQRDEQAHEAAMARNRANQAAAISDLTSGRYGSGQSNGKHRGFFSGVVRTLFYIYGAVFIGYIAFHFAVDYFYTKKITKDYFNCCGLTNTK